jgi:predicted O-methyltransferase YrrM
MSTQTLNLTEPVYRYFQAHAYRESSILANLREETLRRFPQSAQMEISPEQGQFMHWLIRTMGAKKVLEIGAFTGYSALWMALALPEDGKLVTCDVNKEFTDLAQDFWRKSGQREKIDLRLGPALETLKEMVHNNNLCFDFIFIDAEKTEYDSYYEYALLLLRSGGVIAIDNTLQKGRVADDANQSPSTLALKALNNKLLHDSRVLLSMLPISDGLTLLYKN